MQRPERSSYTALDFLAWRESGALELTPKFQRRSVWTLPARSYLIDTLIRGLPVPPIYLRITQSGDRKRMIRQVVDGQQRVSSLLGYIDGDFSLSRTLDAPYKGKAFTALTEAEQDAVRTYGFICEVLHGVSDAEVLEVFARLNTYSVKLNGQELRNGKYFGFFKQTAYRLAFEHLEYWRRHRLFADSQIARMAEVELTSELMVAQLAGQQDKKDSLNSYYANKDETFPEREKVETRFRDVLDVISQSLGDGLATSEFRRPPLFYTLFSVVYHRQYRMDDQPQETPTRRLNEDDRLGLRNAVMQLSDILSLRRQDEPIPANYESFVNASLSQTDNIQPRRARFAALYDAAFG